MSRFLEEAKRFVMQSFSERSEVGEPFDMRHLVQRSHTLSPPVKDKIEEALSELVNDGILDEEGRITAFGIDTHYPVNYSHLRDLFVSFMRNNRMKPEDHIPWDLLVKQVIFPHSLVGRQKAALFEEVIPSLAAEGFLDNPAEGAYFLTQKGYESLY